MSYRLITYISIAVLASACASTKEPTLAEQIHSRGEARVDIAQRLKSGEAQIKRGQKLLSEAMGLRKDADKAKIRAERLAKEAQKHREKADRLQAEGDKLVRDGNAAINAATEDYRRLKERAPVSLPTPAQ